MLKSNKIISVMALSLALCITSCNASNSNENSSSSEETMNFEDFSLEGYTANISNARALGIKEKSNTLPLAASNETPVNKNSIIMDTINGKQTTMTFNKVIHNESGELVDEYKPIVATADKETINIVSQTNTKIVIKSLPDRKYYLSNKEDGKEIENTRLNGTGNNIELSIPKGYSLDKVEVKSISINASITFMTTEGFKYSLYDGVNMDSPIVGYEDIKDKSTLDKDGRDLFIKLEGLEEGKEYQLRYSGTGKIINIGQEDLPVEVDKLYVDNDFTFVSFVPEGTSERQFQTFENNEDTVNEYDKNDYYSNTYDRKSYIIDNKTGLTYFIENFKITNVNNGLIKIDIITDYNSNLKNKNNLNNNTYYKPGIYDYKINLNNELELEPIFTNERLNVKDFFKDKYGYKYIFNDGTGAIDKVDLEKKVIYFSSFNKTSYFHTNLNEVLLIKYVDREFKDIKIIDENFNKKSLLNYTNFTCDKRISDDYFPNPIKFENNNLFYSEDIDEFNYFNQIVQLGKINLIDKTNKGLNLFDYENHHLIIGYSLDSRYLYKYYNYDIIIEYKEKKLIVYNNIWEAIDRAYHYYNNDINHNSIKICNIFEESEKDIIFDNCVIDYGKIFVTNELGNNEYILTLEQDINGKYIIVPVLSSEYVPPKNIVLQPIN